MLHYFLTICFAIAFVLFGWCGLVGINNEDEPVVGIGLLGMIVCGILLGGMLS